VSSAGARWTLVAAVAACADGERVQPRESPMPSVILVRLDAPPAEQPTSLPSEELALLILLRRLDTNERGMFCVPTNWVHGLPQLVAVG